MISESLKNRGRRVGLFWDLEGKVRQAGYSFDVDRKEIRSSENEVIFQVRRNDSSGDSSQDYALLSVDYDGRRLRADGEFNVPRVRLTHTQDNIPHFKNLNSALGLIVRLVRENLVVLFMFLLLIMVMLFLMILLLIVLLSLRSLWMECLFNSFFFLCLFQILLFEVNLFILLRIRFFGGVNDGYVS